jgi:glycosyltransferase involved in cell wall biosynthesis
MSGFLNSGSNATTRIESEVAPTVSVVIPCRNEQAHIEACVRSMLEQHPPVGGFEILVVDGRSTDQTRAILGRLSTEHPALRVLDNDGQIVSAGLNAGIAAARGRIIIRADAHTAYASDYVRNCVASLEASGADNVGGPWHAVGHHYISRAVAAAFHSRFGSGGALAHNLTYEGPVDTVYLGCWHRDIFQRLGGFDEELVRNQDDEFNLRIRRQGGMVWQSRDIKSWYQPRSSLRDLFRQYMQYGYWKVRVIRKHRLPASWRHLVPPLLVLSLILAALGSWVSPATLSAALIVFGLYAAGLVAAAIVTARSSEWMLLPVLPAVFLCFHIGYGFGFLRGIVDFVIRRRSPASDMSSISRRASSPPASLT